MPDSEGKV
jgi:serine/threonine protein kinase